MAELSDAPAVAAPAEIQTIVTSSEVEKPAAPAGGDAPKADAAPATGEKTPDAATQETKPEGEDTTGEKPGDAETDAAKAKKAERQKMNRLYREAAQHRAKAELLADENARLRQAQQAPAQIPQPALGEPDPTKFEDIKEYTRAVEAYTRSKMVGELTTQQQTALAQASQKRVVESWEKHMTAGEDKYDDFHEKVGDLQPNKPWSRALMLAPNGADVAYHLAQDMVEARRIDGLSPEEQILAIGKISAKLEATPAKAPVLTKAPPPIEPVSGGTVLRSEAPSDDDDIATWMKKENIRVAKAQGARL